VALAAACFGERERPAPPRLELLLTRHTVRSPDQLTMTVRARDPDGLDSLWLRFDQREDGIDGLLDQTLEAQLTMPVRSGHAQGTALELRLRGRDLAGFSDTVWDTVVVMP
jgi:hypothetical protein